MKIRITQKKAGNNFEVGEIVNIDGTKVKGEKYGDWWHFCGNNYALMEKLKDFYEFEEVKEVFDIKDLKSGMVVEWQGIAGGIYRDLVIDVSGNLQGLSLKGDKYTDSYNNYTKILRVWKPNITYFNGIERRVTDDCLIYEAKPDKTEKQQEIDKLKQEIKEFTDKARERLKKLEELEG